VAWLHLSFPKNSEMRHVKNMMLVPATLLALLALPAAANAGSVPAPDSRITMATAACQTALPVFDGVVRKRPLAVQNEGSSGTFVTCGLEGKFGAQPVASYIFIGLVNNSSSATTVNCTLVDGRSSISDPVYLPKSLLLPANQPLGELGWSSADNAGNNFIYPAISCSLPPGTGIKAVGQYFSPPAP
jgi:hypothetical protein